MSKGMRFGICMIIVGLTLMGVPVLPVIGVYLIIKYGSILLGPTIDKCRDSYRRTGRMGFFD
mgnify:CR=1 FL=1